MLRKEISDIIANKVKDPRLGFITVTDVEVSPDLKLARAYISVLEEEDIESTMEGLEAARSFIRSELGKRVHMRFIPSVEFRLDTASKYGNKIDRLLQEIRRKS
jgi:ribosome-binding factor A